MWETAVSFHTSSAGQIWCWIRHILHQLKTQSVILHCLLWILAARSSSIFLPSLLLRQPPTAGVPPVCPFRARQLICQPWPQAEKLFPALQKVLVQGTVIRIDFTARQERAPLNSPNTGSPYPKPVTRFWEHSSRLVHVCGSARMT